MLSRTGQTIYAATLALVLLLIAVPPQAVSAGAFERGLKAYDAGEKTVSADDYDTFVAEWRSLAESGDAVAQYNLGLMYHNGQGVPQNYVLAHMWSNLAAAHGNESASGSDDGELGNRDLLAKQMTPAQIAEAQALAARCLASDYRDCGE